MRRNLSIIAILASLLVVRSLFAEMVHVSVRTVAGSTTNVLVDAVSAETGSQYKSCIAPDVPGYIFTEWEISSGQLDFKARDFFGRANDEVSFVVYEDTTLTAKYIPSTMDDDHDGVPDGYQLYWYGMTTVGGDSDTDGDGYTFAEELSFGTNPLFPEDGYINGNVGVVGGDVVQVNPYSMQPYTIRSEPEGTLFATVSDYVKFGTRINAETQDWRNSAFAYWKVNGVRQADIFGRAVDSVSLTMPSNEVEIVAVCENDPLTRAALYWYGDGTVSGDSDTDGDGYTFAEELLFGTNPLFPEDGYINGNIGIDDGEKVEINAQPYEQMRGAIVDGAYEELFTSRYPDNSSSSLTFANGGQIWPVVADVNDDGLWDIIVVSATTANVYLNCGAKGNPEFARVNSKMDVSGYVNTNTLELIDTLVLDVAPVGAISATTNGKSLLVSDSDGRIWYYEDGVLQHKVWGGSFGGFAQGLMIAAVDWEDDGDLDCLCGTADGKLMLLRDPKVGRPTNLKALTGQDNVLLTWDPNVQSRIRGYRVYRSEADADSYLKLVSPYTPLPTYRDMPPAIQSYDYKVSSVSRFYTAGNSTPTETESIATEPVRAELGTVKFFWNDAAVKCGERVEVMLSIENSLNYDVAGRVQVVNFDPEYLSFAKIMKTGLTENITMAESCAEGVLTISMTAGTLAAGSGKFVTLVFDTLKSGTTTVGEATVTIAESDPRYFPGDVDGDGQLTFDDYYNHELHRAMGDRRKFQQLISGRKWTANELKAGDLNGDRAITAADYLLFMELLREKGIIK